MTAGVSNVAVKVPAHSVAPKKGPWSTSREPPSLWSSDIDGKMLCSVYGTALLLSPACVGVILQSFVTFHKSGVC